jgi:hypothetical protein
MGDDTTHAQRIAILAPRRGGARALYQLLAPTLRGRLLGGQPFHWDNVWGDVSRSFHAGQREQAQALLDACLAKGALFHHRYDTEAWDFNEMLLGALARAGYRLLVMQRELSVEHLFSIIASEHLNCRDASDVQRLRERLGGGAEVEAPDADETRRQVQLQWQTQSWFQRVLGACPAAHRVCRYERLFLRGVAGLQVADELFGFAGLGPRNALVDDASLLRFLFSGQHYTAGLAAYSPALGAMRSCIEAELSRLQSEAVGQPVGQTEGAHGGR